MNTSRQTVFAFFYKIAISAITFLNSILTARYLPKVGRLDFQLTTSVSNAGMTYVGGYNGYFSYALSKREEDLTEIVQMGNLFMFTLALLIWIVALGARAVMGPAFHTAWLWAFIGLPFNFIVQYASRLLQGTNQLSWLNRVLMAQPILFFIIYLPLFFDKQIPANVRLLFTYASWIVTFAIAAGGGMLVTYLLLSKHSLMAGRRRDVLRWRFSRREFRGIFNYGQLLSISNIVNTINYRMDFWLVAVFIPARIAADYAIAVTASEVLLNISGSVIQVVYKRMAGGSRKDAILLTEQATRQTFLSSAIVAVGMYIVFPWLMVFAYGQRYAGALLPFYILLPGLIVKASSNVVLQYITNQLGRPQLATVWNGLSAAINAGLCVLLLPTMSLAGGAIASTGSYVLSYAVMVIWFSRYNQVPVGGLIRIRRSDFAPYQSVISSVLRRIGIGRH